MKILTLVGSLRKDSVNLKAAKALQEELPSGVSLDFGEIGDFPLYNQDVQEQGFPSAVLKLAEKIRSADAVLFSTPEYNYSVPGVLKNALDWISRVPDQPFNGKAGAIIGASPGNIGTARAQYHLRQIGVFLNIKFINRPEAMIGQAYGKFDETGRLTDQPTRDHLKKVGLALIEAVSAGAK